MSGALRIDLTSSQSESPRPKKRMKSEGRERRGLEGLEAGHVIDLSDTPVSQDHDHHQDHRWSPSPVPCHLWGEMPVMAPSASTTSRAESDGTSRPDVQHRLSFPSMLCPRRDISHEPFRQQQATAARGNNHHSQALSSYPRLIPSPAELDAAFQPHSDAFPWVTPCHQPTTHTQPNSVLSTRDVRSPRRSRWEAPHPIPYRSEHIHPGGFDDGNDDDDDEVAIVTPAESAAQRRVGTPPAFYYSSQPRSCHGVSRRPRQSFTRSAELSPFTYSVPSPASVATTEGSWRTTPFAMEARCQPRHEQRSGPREQLSAHNHSSNQSASAAATAAAERRQYRARGHQDRNAELQRALHTQKSIQDRLATLMQDDEGSDDHQAWSAHGDEGPEPPLRSVGLFGEFDEGEQYAYHVWQQEEAEAREEFEARQRRTGRHITTARNRAPPSRRDAHNGPPSRGPRGNGAASHVYFGSGRPRDSRDDRRSNGGRDDRWEEHAHEGVISDMLSMLTEQSEWHRYSEEVGGHGDALFDPFVAMEGHPMFGSGHCRANHMAAIRAAMAGMSAHSRLPAQLLYTDRDFDENDYEALLALDDTIENRKGASQSAIDRLEVVTRSVNSTVEAKEANEEDEPRCPICLSDYEAGEPLRRLPCKHQFHRECVDEWLLRKATCPICAREAV